MADTAADVLIDTLHDWGVEVIFGLPGDGINGIMEALRKRQAEIRFIQVRHEESAAFMACGYAKFTGKLGVCLATSDRKSTRLNSSHLVISYLSSLSLHDALPICSSIPSTIGASRSSSACQATASTESWRRCGNAKLRFALSKSDTRNLPPSWRAGTPSSRGNLASASPRQIGRAHV